MTEAPDGGPAPWTRQWIWSTATLARFEPDQLWVTDITEHPTREGKVYCAVVLDVFSRRVVGWSIDNSATSGLVTSALGMAIGNRQPDPGTVIHSDQGTQGGFNWWSQHFVIKEVCDGCWKVMVPRFLGVSSLGSVV